MDSRQVAPPTMKSHWIEALLRMYITHQSWMSRKRLCKFLKENYIKKATAVFLQ